MKIENDLFDAIWNGSLTGSDPKLLELAYEAISEIEFTDLICVRIPDIDCDTLSSWQSLEFWLSDIYPSLTVEHIWSPEFGDMEDDVLPPSAIFPSTPLLIESVLNALRIINEESGSLSVGYAEVTDGEQYQYFVYTDFDAWTLGHAIEVVVLKDMNKLSEIPHFH